MGWRFRKRIGGRWAGLNLSRRGVGASFTIPGTGLSRGVSPGRKAARRRDGGGCGCGGCATLLALGLLALVPAAILTAPGH